MKHKIQKVELFIGVIIFLGGLLTYGLGVHQLLPVPRPDLVVYGTTLIGIILIFMGCDIFSKPTKEMQILENDERNVEFLLDTEKDNEIVYISGDLAEGDERILEGDSIKAYGKVTKNLKSYISIWGEEKTVVRVSSQFIERQ